MIMVITMNNNEYFIIFSDFIDDIFSRTMEQQNWPCFSVFQSYRSTLTLLFICFPVAESLNCDLKNVSQQCDQRISTGMEEL